MKRKRYSANLSNQLAVCDTNYAKIMSLLPEGGEGSRQFAVRLAGQGSATIALTVLENWTYTTLVQLKQLNNTSSWLPGIAFTVRVCHDARVAEVVEYQSHRRIKAVNEYPNAAMYQPDEKAQANVYLGEWLSHCLTAGHLLNPQIAYCE